MQNLVLKWRELAPLFFRATATSPLFFTSAPPRRAPSFSVRASGAVALKVAQVPSTAAEQSLPHSFYCYQGENHYLTS